ncbi:glycolipid transfer protein [Oesophagostomum dentatum]|uniref:Glycolipid transfer protein n=1 Tax=Oesophagostomum dentatum TaxID=61180 RepID=A0A0B1T995_OESDE|nr:glycolipid transfer protein [Oesophagostomum dentatum]
MSSGSPLEEETYFSKPAHLFPYLEDGKIPTEQFLSACQGIADFVGQRYLQDLIDADLRDNGGKLGIATEGLLWLKRGLEFMLEMLTLMVEEYRSSADKNKTENLAGVINAAYKRSLERHHGFMSKQIFKVHLNRSFHI